MLAWNVAATSQDGVRTGGTPGVATYDDRAITNKTPRGDKEAGCGAASGATERGGAGATLICNTKDVRRGDNAL